jgi:hypothetical protein
MTSAGGKKKYLQIYIFFNSGWGRKIEFQQKLEYLILFYLNYSLGIL